MAFLGALLSGAGSAVGSSAGNLIGNLPGMFIQDAVQDRNVEKAQKYAQRMAMNRYQWARRDLELARLNPMLAFGGAPIGGHANALGVQMGSYDPFRQELERAQAKAVRAETPRKETMSEIFEVIRDIIREVKGASAADVGKTVEMTIEGLAEQAMPAARYVGKEVLRRAVEAPDIIRKAARNLFTYGPRHREPGTEGDPYVQRPGYRYYKLRDPGGDPFLPHYRGKGKLER